MKLDFPGLSSGVATKIAVMFTSLTVKWNPESIKSIASEVDHNDGCSSMLDFKLSLDFF